MESWDQSTPPLPKLLSYTWKHRLPHMCSTLFSLLFLFPQVPIHKKVDGNMDITHLHCCQTCPGSFFFFFKGHRSARKESWGSISTHPTFNMTMSQDTASGRNTSLICVQEARWACTQTGVHSCRRANPAKFSNPSSSSHNAVTMWCDC